MEDRSRGACWRRYEDDGGGGDRHGGADLGGGATSRPWAAVCRPGWRVLQVHDDGGGSRATTTEAGGGVDDAHTGLGDADSDGASLAMEAEIGAERAQLGM